MLTIISIINIVLFPYWLIPNHLQTCSSIFQRKSHLIPQSQLLPYFCFKKKGLCTQSSILHIPFTHFPSSLPHCNFCLHTPLRWLAKIICNFSIAKRKACLYPRLLEALAVFPPPWNTPLLLSWHHALLVLPPLSIFSSTAHFPSIWSYPL